MDWYYPNKMKSHGAQQQAHRQHDKLTFWQRTLLEYLHYRLKSTNVLKLMLKWHVEHDY